MICLREEMRCSSSLPIELLTVALGRSGQLVVPQRQAWPLRLFSRNSIRHDLGMKGQVRRSSGKPPQSKLHPEFPARNLPE